MISLLILSVAAKYQLSGSSFLLTLISIAIIFSSFFWFLIQDGEVHRIPGDLTFSAATRESPAMSLNLSPNLPCPSRES
jgi:hypothetical protein